MSATRRCPECGTDLPPGAPGGLCPRCLLGAALSSTAGHTPASGRTTTAPASPVGLNAFRAAVVELGLVPAEELEAAIARASGQVADLARDLVRAGRLTPYQAGALAQGKAKGLVIGDYLIAEKRGRGGMGVVFKATQRRTGRVVALKILPPSFGRDREAVLRFRREFEVAARLDHPNIVRAIEADEDRGVQYLSMDYIDGHDLDALVGTVGPLPRMLALHVAIQAAKGLAAAHDAGIVHRDVKPGNLMLDAGGNVRVLDLGLARIVEAATPLGRGAEGTLTQSGAYMGTVDFMAPEQADDSKRAGHAADIYSLGCTLYFLLAGRPPFDGETVLKRLMAHQSSPAPSLHAARNDVPAALEAAYQTMMAKRPGDRPRSMAEVVAMLESCRATADESKQARASLKGFAETVMKRAAPRKRDEGLDASVFARSRPAGGLQFDPDLRLEDLLSDYRDDAPPKPLDEEKLPPKAAPIRRPRARRRRLPLLWPALAALGVLGLVVVLVLGRSRGPSEPKPTAPTVTPLSETTTPTTPKVDKPGGPFRPLLARGLVGWAAKAGNLTDWGFDGAILSGRAAGDKGVELVSDATYRNAVFRMEYRVEDGATGDVLLLGSEPGPHRTVMVRLGDKAGGKDTGGLGSADADGKEQFKAPWIKARLNADDDWNRLEVDLRDGLLTLRVNGRPVCNDQDYSDLAGPRKVGFRARGGRVRFRNVQVLDLEAVPRASWPLRTFYEDELDDPGKFVYPEGHEAGTADGHSYFQAAKPVEKALWVLPLGLPESFSIEAVGRVLARSSDDAGSWGLNIQQSEKAQERSPGISVRIDSEGRLWIGPSPWGASKYPDLPPPRGPIAHKAIKPGGEWNTLRLDVQRGRVEILINGVAVVEPLTLDWLTDAHHIDTDLRCTRGAARIEFDRFVIRELPDPQAGPPTIAREAKAAPGRVLFSDDFSDPSSGWHQQLNKHPFHGYAEGRFFINAEPGETWFWNAGDRATAASDTSVEVTGRVLQAGSTAPGAWAAVLTPNDETGRGFTVAINQRGALTIGPVWYARDADRYLVGPILHPAIKPGDQFNTIALHMRRGEMDVFVNSVPVCDSIPLDPDMPPLMLHLAVFASDVKTRSEVDRVLIREGRPADVGPFAGPRPGRRLYADDFADPKTGWNQDPTPMGKGLRPFRQGYDRGVYFLEAPENWTGTWASADCTPPIAEPFQFEGVGRVLGVGAAEGAWGLMVVGPDERGFQVMIDRVGRLFIDPAFYGWERFPNDRHFGPIQHEAIRLGEKWNRLALRVKKRRLEVLANGVMVAPAVDIDWDLTPARARFYPFKPAYDTRIRVEIDRVELRALTGG